MPPAPMGARISYGPSLWPAETDIMIHQVYQCRRRAGDTGGSANACGCFGAAGADAEFDGIVRLGKDCLRLDGTGEHLIDFGTFQRVADLTLARPGAQQQDHQHESHSPSFYTRISILRPHP